MAAADINIVRRAHIPNMGDLIEYKIVLSASATAFDLSAPDTGDGADASWSDVSMAIATPTTTSSGVGEVIFDGTKISGAGFAANDTIKLVVIGRRD